MNKLLGELSELVDVPIVDDYKSIGHRPATATVWSNYCRNDRTGTGLWLPASILA